VRLFTRAFLTASGATLGVAFTFTTVAYLGGRIAESRLKTTFADWEKEFRARTEEYVAKEQER
jgi:hypothetical protein